MREVYARSQENVCKMRRLPSAVAKRRVCLIPAVLHKRSNPVDRRGAACCTSDTCAALRALQTVLAAGPGVQVSDPGAGRSRHRPRRRSRAGSPSTSCWAFFFIHQHQSFSEDIEDQYRPHSRLSPSAEVSVKVTVISPSNAGSVVSNQSSATLYFRERVLLP